ncbi:hypothetical protein F5876DRAFT_48419, partial [Lentinula aff. lateritia]
SEAYYTLENRPPGSVWDTIAGLNKTRDDKFIRVHTNFPHHRRGILSILGLTDSPDLTRDHVQKAFLQWDADAFEEKAAESGMCAFASRTFEEWDRHPQGLMLFILHKNNAPRKCKSRPGKRKFPPRKVSKEK